MPSYIMVIESPSDLDFGEKGEGSKGEEGGEPPPTPEPSRSSPSRTLSGVPVLTTAEHLARPDDERLRGATVINLARDFRYLGSGYYVSLLAEARGARVMPSIEQIQELSRKTIYSPFLAEFDRHAAKAIARQATPPAGTFSLHVFFGLADDDRFRDLARAVFDRFRCPLLKIDLDPPDPQQQSWHVAAIRPLPIRKVKGDLAAHFRYALDAYTKAPWRAVPKTRHARYDIAILWNPKEQCAPSTDKTLKKLIKIGRTMDIDVELVEKKDITRVAEFDFLFIRETTALDDHTFRFAKKAEQEGIPVIDDPTSILRCCNKVYLAELLRQHRLPTPHTVMLEKSTPLLAERSLAYPMVLKVPDGSFSRGVFKAANRAELMEISARLFAESDIIIAQEWMPTEFDWRIGVLNRQPIFAAQYMMAKKHWQVARHGPNNRIDYGGSQHLPVAEAPRDVVELGVKAAGLIGDGLYGVDIKKTEKGAFVIEINDNPNVDCGYEDKVLGDELYRILFRDFIRRIESVSSQVAARPRPPKSQIASTDGPVLQAPQPRMNGGTVALDTAKEPSAA